jgi:two-component system, LytTR family, sensor kinase
MMSPAIPIKKLFKTAFYTSVLIGALGIAPIAVVHSVPLVGLVTGIAQHTFLIFFIWTVNILIVYLTEKYNHGRFPAYTRYVLSYIICVALLVSTRIFLTPVSGEHDAAHFLRHSPEITFGRHGKFAGVIMGFALNTIILIIQDLILLREKKTRIELENAALKIKNTEATNQQLKQQIHPHFLFNSLNTLKSLINKDPGKAEDYLIMLSDFLRASISSNSPNTVKLKEEIRICIDYLEMQRVRFGEALQYSIDIPDEARNSVFVPAFSLLPLLENSIKHNALTEEQPLYVKVKYENGWIITSNNRQPKTLSEPSTGLGLQNLAERYRILSGDEVKITSSEAMFTISIKALGSENSDHRR